MSTACKEAKAWGIKSRGSQFRRGCSTGCSSTTQTTSTTHAYFGMKAKLDDNVTSGDLDTMIRAWDKLVADHPEYQLQTAKHFSKQVPKTRRTFREGL